MIMSAFDLKTTCAGLILGVALYQDLKSQKVTNQLVVVALVVSLVLVFAQDGFSGFWPALSSFGTAIICALPLYLLRAIGGGDFKLVLAISPLMTWNAVMLTILASLFWGALLGVIRVALQGKGKQFATNMVSIIMRSKTEPTSLSKIPFTVGLLFGWLTQISLQQAGVHFL
ncbi:MAG: hypothetical protein BroJett040_25510 [Oligoflexia bacterium]|nr:MAG: hypothetical protein BroJett040_25510 [Oligoflexia bacterium]